MTLKFSDLFTLAENACAQRIQTFGKAGGWQGEQGRTERRGFGTGTVHKEAEGMRKDEFGMAITDPADPA